MTDILNKTIVLVLNRNWQAIHVRTPQEAFCTFLSGSCLWRNNHPEGEL